MVCPPLALVVIPTRNTGTLFFSAPLDRFLLLSEVTFIRTKGKKPQQQPRPKQTNKQPPNSTATEPTNQQTKRNAKPIETKHPVTKFETLPG